MKKALLLLLLLIAVTSYSQNRYSKYIPTSNYQSENFNDRSYVALEMKRKHDSNLKYLYEIKDWILELKTKIEDDDYIEKLNKIYKGLSKLQKTNLANSYEDLKEVELYINYKIIEPYNEELKNGGD